MKFPVTIPFVEHLGFELLHFADGQARIAFTPQLEHLNSFQVAHGGASMTLLDVVMAHAARSVEPGVGAVTIEMKTSFMAAATGPLVAHGALLQRTATLAFTEGRILDAEGKLCAHATGTFKYVRRLPMSAKSSHALNGPATD